MIHVETSVEPPVFDSTGDGDDQTTINVTLWMSEADGTHRTGSILLAADATDAEIADALVACLRGCAAMRGPGLVAAVGWRLR